MASSTDRMTFVQRFKNFIFYFLENQFIKTMFTTGIETVIKQHFPDFSMDVSSNHSSIFKKKPFLGSYCRLSILLC